MSGTRSLVVLVLLLAALPARSQETPTESSEPPPSQVPRDFLEQYLSYDRGSGRASIGRTHRPLTPTEFFTVLERPDLVERSAANARRRLLLAIGGGTVAATGTVLAVVFWSRVPDLNSRFCVADEYNYNEICVPRYKRYQAGGGIALVSGIVLGGILGTLAYWSDPGVLSPDEALALTSQYNAALLGRLRKGQGTSEAPRLRLIPYASDRGAGLLTTFTF